MREHNLLLIDNLKNAIYQECLPNLSDGPYQSLYQKLFLASLSLANDLKLKLLDPDNSSSLNLKAIPQYQALAFIYKQLLELNLPPRKLQNVAAKLLTLNLKHYILSDFYDVLRKDI